MTFDVIVALAGRLCLVLLFLPFSALDKLVNFGGAVGQASQAVSSRRVAAALVVCGCLVEVVMSAGVLTGTADRAAALVLAGYCGVTALLWKPFWREPDFALRGASKGRDLFWDFLKNFAVAGGFLAVAWGGPSAAGFRAFLDAPFASTQPYATPQPRAGR